MKDKIKRNKSLFIFFMLVVLTIIYKSINIFSVVLEKSSYEIMINEINNQIDTYLNAKSNNEKYNKMDVSYYVNNIYAYSVLKNMKNIQITQKDSRYNKSSCLEITFDLVDSESFKQMIKDFSLLGFIDVAENGKILLNVSSFSDAEAKSIIEKGE